MRSKSSKHYQFLAVAICIIAINSGVFAASADTNTPQLQPQALDFVGIYALREIEPNLAGAGIKFGIISRSYTYSGAEPQNDYAIPAKHPCFAGKNVFFYDDGQMPQGISPHAAAVASILLGEDANGTAAGIGSFSYEGVAPKATADIFEFRHFIRDIVFDGNAVNVDVISMSLGSQFEDWWTRGVNRIAEANGICIVAGVGNGTNVEDPVLYPAGGPNVLAVGVVDSADEPNDLLLELADFSVPSPEHSSVGSTQDGRCKPDIVAPSNCLAATTDANNTYEPTGNWSSFSTPLVAGTIGLLVQKAKSDPNLQEAIAPSGNCVLKAIVMNSAQKLPSWHKGLLTKDDDHQVPLDYLQGAGMLDAVAAYQQLIAGRPTADSLKTRGWDNNVATPGGAKLYDFKTDKTMAGGYITATLVWNRHFQDRYPFEPLGQKDLNLKLELWAVDSNNPQNGRLLDYSDSQVDNVQHVYYPVEPNAAEYRLAVSVSSYNTADANLTERYGLAWDVKENPEPLPAK